MEFLGISIWELLLILIVALIVLGPSKLPGIARNLGKTIRAIRKASSDLTTAVTREVESATSTEPPPQTDKSRKNEKTPPHPGTAGAQKKENQIDKPEGQPPQNEQQ